MIYDCALQEVKLLLGNVHMQYIPYSVNVWWRQRKTLANFPSEVFGE